MRGNAKHPGTIGPRLAHRAGAFFAWARPALLVLLAASLVRARTLRTEPAAGGGSALAQDVAAPFGGVWFLDCGFLRQCRLVSDDGEWVVISDESGDTLLEFVLEEPSVPVDPPYRALPPEGAVPVEGAVLKGAPPLPAGFPFAATPTPPPGSTPAATPTPRPPGTPTPDTTPTKTRY